MTDNQSTLSRCISFAARKHDDQAYTGYGSFKFEPYICHSLRVMLRCSQKNKNRFELMQIAILHDILEDTDTTLEEIKKETGVGFDILDALEAITKKDSEEYSEYIDRLSKKSILAQIVKIEDLLENLSRNPPESLEIRYRKAILKLSPALAWELDERD